jgi:hypothetical protein
MQRVDASVDGFGERIGSVAAVGVGGTAAAGSV